MMRKKTEMRTAACECAHLFKTSFLRKSQFFPYQNINSGVRSYFPTGTDDLGFVKSIHSFLATKGY